MSEIVQQQDSRRIFVDTLTELAKKDDKILLITCDVGFNYLNKFQELFPRRFLNLGVTEQSSVMIATALALDGWKPYIYSMINFVLFRPAEMVRNGIVCHKANVKLIGVKGSSGYKFLGFSHNMLSLNEDINFCENIGLRWHIADKENTKDLISEDYLLDSPCYIRLQ